MTHEEAKLTIEYLKKMQEEYIEGEGYERHPLPEWYALDKAIETIEQTRWIPVSERLSEEGVDVLACFYIGEGNYKIMVSRRSDYNYWSGVGRTADMVAWMPLPIPYEPQEREDE